MIRSGIALAVCICMESVRSRMKNRQNAICKKPINMGIPMQRTSLPDFISDRKHKS